MALVKHKDSEKQNFDAVIMYTLDRFARNRYDSAIYKAKLKKNGVKVYYAKQPMPDTPVMARIASIDYRFRTLTSNTAFLRSISIETILDRRRIAVIPLQFFASFKIIDHCHELMLVAPGEQFRSSCSYYNSSYEVCQ